jgi:hypothetical protein
MMPIIGALAALAVILAFCLGGLCGAERARRCEVDEDVKLSMEQTQERWMTKMVLLMIAIAFGTVVFWVHDCNQATVKKPEEPCTEAIVKPSDYNRTLQCPSPRQTLTFPPGWTWAKCSCPEPAKPAASN